MGVGGQALDEPRPATVTAATSAAQESCTSCAPRPTSHVAAAVTSPEHFIEHVPPVDWSQAAVRSYHLGVQRGVAGLADDGVRSFARHDLTSAGSGATHALSVVRDLPWAWQPGYGVWRGENPRFALPGDSLNGFPYGCFQALEAMLQLKSSLYPGLDWADTGWRATALDTANLTNFDPWSTANVLANDATWSRRGSPGGDRLCIAISPDGRSWYKTGQVLMDGASVPALAVETNANGEEVLYAFFNCSTYQLDDNGDLQTKTDPESGEIAPDGKLHLSVAYTTNLWTWTYRHLTGDGAPPGTTLKGIQQYDADTPDASWWNINDPADPSVTQRPGGGWYLLVTLNRLVGDSGSVDVPSSSTLMGADTFVLKATNLYDFTWFPVNGSKRLYPTDALEAEDPHVGAYDPDGFTTGSTLQYFASPGDFPQNWDVQFSIDTATDLFTPSIESEFTDAWTGTLAGVPVVDGAVKVSNQASIASYTSTSTFGTRVSGPDETVLYGFVQPRGAPRCIISYTQRYTVGTWVTDAMGVRHLEGGGRIWAIDNGGAAILEPDRAFEGAYVMDAAVVRFQGCYVMVYTAELPHS